MKLERSGSGIVNTDSAAYEEAKARLAALLKTKEERSKLESLIQRVCALEHNVNLQQKEIEELKNAFESNSRSR